MKKDLILEELARMREIMGISNTIKKISSDIKLIKEVQINLNENLITEGKGDPIDLLKAIAGQKMVDEVTALSIQSSKYFTEELTKRLANTELKTIDDLSKAMADEYKAKGS